MLDEEKKAIKEVKHFNQLTRYWQEEEYEEKEIAEYITTILNLIEKQSKEIEKLKGNDLRKDELVANMSTRHFHDREKIRKYEALQDKIKAKIEGVDIQLQKLKDGLTGRKTNFVNKNMLFAQKKALQSLLEKE